MENNALQEVRQENSGWGREQVEVIKRTVAKDATDDELRMFLHLAGAYGLDPFARDIWFIKDPRDANSRPIIMTSRDGYMKIANRNPNFDGLEADVVYEGDAFRKRPDGGFEHAYNTKARGGIIGAYAVIYRKDRKHPVSIFVPFNDYRKNSPVWRQYPHAMILKVAESQALKRAFSISGMVTAEELGDNAASLLPQGVNNINPPESARPSPFENSVKLIKAKLEAEKGRLWELYLNLCGSPDLAKGEMQKAVGAKPSAEWTEIDVKLLWERYEALKGNPEFAPVLDVESMPFDGASQAADSDVNGGI